MSADFTRDQTARFLQITREQFDFALRDEDLIELGASKDEAGEIRIPRDVVNLLRNFVATVRGAP